ncbi:MAG: DUF3303 family protein [Planctomycetota bacterium]
MQFMVQWKIVPTDYRAAAETFLRSGAPMPLGLTMLGRWHAPGSGHGWLLCETDDLTTLVEHLAQWGEHCDFKTTPVVSDEVTGEGLARVYR